MSTSNRMMAALEKWAPSLVDNVKLKLDGFRNELTGFGTERDKTIFGRSDPFVRIDDVELSALFHTNDVAERMVSIVPDEMLREGFEVDVGDGDSNSAIAEKFKELDVIGKYGDGVRWGRLYGGAALLIGCDDGQDASQPLKPERANDIRYLYVIERRVLWPLTYYSTPGHPKLGEPETYVVTPTVVGGTGSSATVVVHESRLILFRGAKTGVYERIAMAGWDVSVLQRPYDVIRQFETGWKAVEVLLTDGNQAVFKMSGLADAIERNGEEILRKRLLIMQLYQSVVRALVVDADSKEEYSRNSISFAGIPEVLEKFMLRLAAAVQIPVTILMGQSPAGMNATGDSDFRWFYAKIRAEQTTVLAPKIRRLADIWSQTKVGRAAMKNFDPKKIGVTFPSLWSETPAAEATRRLAVAQADDIYLKNEVYTPEEVALARSRPEGYSADIVPMTPEARDAREKLLATDLPKLIAGTLKPPPDDPKPAGGNADDEA